MPEQDYKSRIIEWAVSHPGGLWADNPGAAAARKWLRKNAPDDFRSLYYNESDETKRGIDRRFLPDGIAEKEMEAGVTDAISSAGKNIFDTVDTVSGFVPGPVGAINWLGHMGADAANGNYGKVFRDAALAGLIGFGANAASRFAGRARDAFRLGSDVIDLSDYAKILSPGNEYYSSGKNVISRVIEPKRIQIDRLIDRANSGIDAPLETNQVDLFGDKLVIPDEFAASMRLDEFRRAYPNGVDFWYRGLDPTEGMRLGRDWRDVHSGYPSIYGGDKVRAKYYTGRAKSPDGSPGLLTLVTPKGEIVDAGDFGGTKWNWITNDPEKYAEAQKRVKDLISKARHYYDFGDDANYEKYSELYNKANMESHKYLGREMPGLEGRFLTTDQIATALKETEGAPKGLLLRNISDGPGVSDVIWSHTRGGAPKAVHPEQTYTFDLSDGRYLACGGKKYPDGGKFFRTNLQNESPLMYQPMMPINYPIETPLRFRPQPDLGDYQAPASTGMMVDYPISLPERVPVSVQEPVSAPVVVEAPVENLFSDEMVARRALKQRYAESAFNDKAKSKAGAQGAWQIMPITLKDYLGRGRGKAGDLNDPVYNRKVRDWVMGIIPRDLQEFWSENDSDRSKLAKLYAAYNWGAGNLRGFLRKKQKAGVDISNPDNWVDDLNPETRRYVKYLAFDEDIPDSMVYTNAAFEKAAAERGYASGGKIHIAPSKRGTFTAAAKKHGKSVQAFASQVLAHKENYSPAMVKKANFARNAAKWHSEGGLLQRYSPEQIRAAISKIRK